MNKKSSMKWSNYGDVGSALDMGKVYEHYCDEPFSAVIHDFGCDETSKILEYQNLIQHGLKRDSKPVQISLGARQAKMWADGYQHIGIRANIFTDLYQDVTRQLLLGLKDSDIVPSRNYQSVNGRFKRQSRIYSLKKKDRAIINSNDDIGCQLRKLFYVVSPPILPILPIVSFNDLPSCEVNSVEKTVNNIIGELAKEKPDEDLVNQLNMTLDIIGGFVYNPSKGISFPKSEVWFSIPGWFFDVVDTDEFFEHQRCDIDIEYLRLDASSSLRNLVLMD